MPLLFLAGAEDTLVPVRRQDFAAQLAPYGTLQVIDGAGHLPTLEQPEAVTAAIEAQLGQLMSQEKTSDYYHQTVSQSEKVSNAATFSDW